MSTSKYSNSTLKSHLGEKVVLKPDELGNLVDEKGIIRPEPPKKSFNGLKKAMIIGAIVVASIYGTLTGMASYNANKKIGPQLESLATQFKKTVETKPFTFYKNTSTLDYNGQLEKIIDERNALLKENNVSLIGLNTGWTAYSLDGITPKASIGSTTVFDPNPVHGVGIVEELLNEYLHNAKK